MKLFLDTFLRCIQTCLFLTAIGEKYIPVIGKIGLLEDNSIISWMATTSSFIMFQQIKLWEGRG